LERCSSIAFTKDAYCSSRSLLPAMFLLHLNLLSGLPQFLIAFYSHRAKPPSRQEPTGRGGSRTARARKSLERGVGENLSPERFPPISLLHSPYALLCRTRVSAGRLYPMVRAKCSLYSRQAAKAQRRPARLCIKTVYCPYDSIFHSVCDGPPLHILPNSFSVIPWRLCVFARD
jgi:hypothetical protein